MSNRLRDMITIQSAILIVLAVSMAVPYIIALYCGEKTSATAFAVVIISCLIVALFIRIFIKPSPEKIKARDGFLVVAICWLSLIHI